MSENVKPRERAYWITVEVADKCDINTPMAQCIERGIRGLDIAYSVSLDGKKVYSIKGFASLRTFEEICALPWARDSEAEKQGFSIQSVKFAKSS